MVRYLAVIFALISFSANATTTAYKIDPANSSLQFEAVQNGAPVAGKFTSFGGIVNFAKDDLANSNANISINMNSVSADYAEVPKTLKEKDWFDVSKFAEAKFESKKFTSSDGKNYQAAGILTIKGISLPVMLAFTLPELTAEKAVAEGTANLSRTKFGIGWADTSSVKDLVKVHFRIAAVKQ